MDYIIYAPGTVAKLDIWIGSLAWHLDRMLKLHAADTSWRVAFLSFVIVRNADGVAM